MREVIDAFMTGFCYGRSFTHPYVVERAGPIQVMRDGPGKKPYTRTEEFVAYGVSPEDVRKAIKEHATGRFALCVVHKMHEDREAIKSAFKGLGLRLRGTEPIFVCDLNRPLPKVSTPDGISLRRVMDPVDAEAIKVMTGGRQILPEDLREDRARLRLFGAFSEGKPVGIVRSTHASDRTTWVSNMSVVPEFRRRGIGKALMAMMLHDDFRLGYWRSVLTASTLGASLYPSVGYEQVALLQLFMPTPKWI
jgi:predicted N-acetyltransferase YhbS